jgi:hypothetical protein
MTAAQTSASPSAAETLIFKSGKGVKVVLMGTFLLLMLFIVNAVVGSIWLATHNLYTDALIFFLLFLAGLVMLMFAGLFLFSASHAEVRFGPEKCVMTLPNWRGPTPMLPYTQIEVPYKDIAAVETRSEVYRYYMLPVLVKSASFVDQNGNRHMLGYVRENASEHALPYHDIADELAKRSGVGVNYRGVIDGGRRFRAMLHDEPSWDAPQMTDNEAQRMKQLEGRAWQYAIIGLFVLVLGGLAFQGVKLITAKTGPAATQSSQARPSSPR